MFVDGVCSGAVLVRKIEICNSQYVCVMSSNDHTFIAFHPHIYLVLAPDLHTRFVTSNFELCQPPPNSDLPTKYNRNREQASNQHIMMMIKTNEDFCRK